MAVRQKQFVSRFAAIRAGASPQKRGRFGVPSRPPEEVALEGELRAAQAEIRAANARTQDAQERLDKAHREIEHLNGELRKLTAQLHLGAASQEQPVKRGPGRPRKHPRSENVDDAR